MESKLDTLEEKLIQMEKDLTTYKKMVKNPDRGTFGKGMGMCITWMKRPTTGRRGCGYGR